MVYLYRKDFKFVASSRGYTIKSVGRNLYRKSKRRVDADLIKIYDYIELLGVKSDG